LSATYDVIVIGAGHNGLTTAAALGRAGRRVLVVEARDVVGGLAPSEEFHPGYRSAGLLHDTSGVRSDVVTTLGLQRHGLRLRRQAADVLTLGDPGDALLLCGEPRRAVTEIESRSAHDAQSYVRYRDALDAWRHVLRSFLNEPPVDLLDPESSGAWDLLKRGLRVRRLGRRDLFELFRLTPMCVADWLEEWFETDLLKAGLALPAVAGTFMAPRSPGSNATLLLREGVAGAGIEAGAHTLIEALQRAAEATGVEVRTGARVSSIRVEGNVRGVSLADGEELQAAVVAASCHPATLFTRLLPPSRVPVRVAHSIERYRSRGTTAHVLFALRSPLRFRGRDEQPEFARIAPGIDAIERAFDCAKHRRMPHAPVLEVHVPSLCSPALAPEGCAVVSILAHFVPYDLDGGWDESRRTQLGDQIEETLGAHCEGLDVAARQVATPVDLEARYALPGGNIHHGEHSLDQLLVRPIPQCNQYRSPIPGLFLCGSGSHPGGGLSCMPGALAARAILAR
jgi:phytoene dehydrogenase-like protein